MQKKIFTVYQTNSYIKRLLEDDVLLSDIFVQGEVSNVKRHSSGHIYFSLKDSHACISCVMFKADTYSLKFNIENGMNVILYGRVSLYEKTGNYQIYVQLIEPEGKGALYISFEQVKKELEEKGFFKKENKKSLPKNPNTIALVTSPTGSVVQDMISISKRRNKGISLIVVPTIVQGKDSIASIVSSIEMVNEWGKADIIIVGRGGGSAEELWAFNEKEVAEAIYRSKIPIISAVGHETDFTLADFVADVRASTPSAAIEISVPKQSDMLEIIENHVRNLEILAEKKLEIKRKNLKHIVSRRIFTHPEGNIYSKQIYLEKLQKELDKEINNVLIKEKSKLKFLKSNLNMLSPTNVLAKGYGIVYKDGKILKSIKEIENTDILKIKLKDGEIVLNTQKGKEEQTNAKKV